MVDIIILAALGVFGLIGYKKGLMKSILTLGSSLIALILSFIVYPIMTIVLRATPIYNWIYKMVGEKVGSMEFNGGVQSQGEAIVQNITWIPKILAEQIKNDNNTAMYKILGATNIKEYIILYITQMLIGLLAILLTWIILKLVLGIVIGLLSTIVEHLPVISTFNRQGGLCIGIVKGLLILSLITLTLPILMEIPTMSNIQSAIQGSYIGKWLYENNLIIIIYNNLFNA